jgi:glycosyltransferase involved in cell wall biosynthesis
VKKVIIFSNERNACSLYRCELPVIHCYHDLSLKGIRLSLSEMLSTSEYADAYIFHRIISPELYGFAHQVKSEGAKVIWHTDDDVFNIPSWNPASQKISENDIRATIDLIYISDRIIVSTPFLGNTLDQFNKPILVLPNLIDLVHYRLQKRPEFNSRIGFKKEKPVRIVWAGSFSHHEDLTQIVNPVKKLIEKYKNKIDFTFFGYLPTGLAKFVRLPGESIAFLETYSPRVHSITELPLRIYIETLENLMPDIALAPLTEHPFNYSKSGIKGFESILAGAAFIGTNLPPYQWIENNKTGLLVQPDDEEGWFQAIEQLILDPILRDKLALHGKEQVIQNHSWQAEKERVKWIDGWQEIFN